MTRRRSSRTGNRLVRTLGVLISGVAIGAATGVLHIWVSGSTRPPNYWLIFTCYPGCFALVAVLGDLVLRSAPPVEVSEQPDPTGWFGKIVGFCFGAVFGLFLAMGITVYVLRFGVSGGVVKLVFVTCVLGCGYFSAKHGEDFWHRMSK